MAKYRRRPSPKGRQHDSTQAARRKAPRRAIDRVGHNTAIAMAAAVDQLPHAASTTKYAIYFFLAYRPPALSMPRCKFRVARRNARADISLTMPLLRAAPDY